MLSFNYTLDSELKAPMGQLPSGIQTQAFGMALTRLARRYHTTKQMLLQQVPGTGAVALMGASIPWQERLKTGMAFLDVVPDKLASVANNVALGGVGNAVYQGRLSHRWNRWAPRALQEYAQAVSAFEAEVSKAMSNSPVAGIPTAMVRLAKLANMAAPLVPNANALSYVDSGLLDPATGQMDPMYMAGLEQMETPLVLGAVAGASLIGLAAWYFSQGARGGMSGMGECRRWKRVRSRFGGTVRRCARY